MGKYLENFGKQKRENNEEDKYPENFESVKRENIQNSNISGKIKIKIERIIDFFFNQSVRNARENF